MSRIAKNINSIRRNTIMWGNIVKIAFLTPFDPINAFRDWEFQIIY